MESEIMAKAGKHGVTANTPKKILFGAGTIHKNFDIATLNFDDTIIGSTNGGSTLAITPEFTKIEIDGALVNAKGLTVKTGETATLEINFAELPEEIITSAASGKVDDTAQVEGYTKIVSKAAIATGDYFENITFVGKTVEGKNIIAILPNALCTSGLELGAANKAGAVATVTFECYAELEGDLDALPWEIYYPEI